MRTSVLLLPDTELPTRSNQKKKGSIVRTSVLLLQNIELLTRSNQKRKVRSFGLQSFFSRTQNSSLQICLILVVTAVEKSNFFNFSGRITVTNPWKHPTSASLCAARTLRDRFFSEFYSYLVLISVSWQTSATFG